MNYYGKDHHTQCVFSLLLEQRGFSFLEFLISVSIFFLILAAGIPQYSELSHSYLRNQASQQFKFDLKRFRTETLAEGTRGIVNIDSAGKTYSFGYDHLPFNDPPNFDSEIYSRTLPENIYLQGTDQIIFDSRGYAVDEDGNLATIAVPMYQLNQGFGQTIIFPVGSIRFEEL